jgi:hypothetical protein
MSKSKKRKVRPALVVWLDAHGDAMRWTHIADLTENPCVIRSVGHVLPRGRGGKKGHVTLAQSFDWPRGSAGLVDNVLHIPVGMVREVVWLTPEA